MEYSRLLRTYESIVMLPGIKQMMRARYARHFQRTQGHLFQGVFPTFEAALAAIPATKPVGYDNDGPAKMYKGLLNSVRVSDYPVLFWLQSILRDHSTVFDCGGHIGVRFYGYQKYLESVSNLQWTVYDVPAVVREGRRLAEEKGVSNLQFVDSFYEANCKAVLLASGSLQYVPQPLSELLSRLVEKPKHVLVNLTPFTEMSDYYTINNIGTAFCPYAIRNRKRFILSIESLGYELVDSWKSPEKVCRIPFHPQHNVDGYDGLYFRRV